MNRDLLPPTVAWEDGAVVLIDQRRLPKELRRVRLETVEEVADAIKDMTVRGAPAIGVAAALGLALAAYRSRSESREGLLREIWSARERLRSTRPTAFNLFWALERVMAKASSARGGVEEVREAAISEALRLAEEDVAANRMIGAYGARLLEDGDRVLTHCKWLRPAECGRARHRGLRDRLGCSAGSG